MTSIERWLLYKIACEEIGLQGQRYTGVMNRVVDKTTCEYKIPPPGTISVRVMTEEGFVRGIERVQKCPNLPDVIFRVQSTDNNK